VRPLTGVLVITATADPLTREPRMRVRSNSDVASDRVQVLDTRDPQGVLDFVGQWLSGFRDAAVTVRPTAPVTVIRRDQEPEREDE
jgi:hypothetical protein